MKVKNDSLLNVKTLFVFATKSSVSQWFYMTLIKAWSSSMLSWFRQFVVPHSVLSHSIHTLVHSIILLWRMLFLCEKFCSKINLIKKIYCVKNYIVSLNSILNLLIEIFKSFFWKTYKLSIWNYKNKKCRFC